MKYAISTLMKAYALLAKDKSNLEKQGLVKSGRINLIQSKQHELEYAVTCISRGISHE